MSLSTSVLVCLSKPINTWDASGLTFKPHPHRLHHPHRPRHPRPPPPQPHPRPSPHPQSTLFPTHPVVAHIGGPAARGAPSLFLDILQSTSFHKMVRRHRCLEADNAKPLFVPKQNTLVQNGKRLHCWEGGEGGAEVVILLHPHYV
ncbi:hypothetical protein BASA82_000602 [Batrachochytrium salamandrivorans]|nr:hypothetical protein BASA82_000602 [Batrachochytrium salamandrivorans]